MTDLLPLFGLFGLLGVVVAFGLFSIKKWGYSEAKAEDEEELNEEFRKEAQRHADAASAGVPDAIRELLRRAKSKSGRKTINKFWE